MKKSGSLVFIFIFSFISVSGYSQQLYLANARIVDPDRREIRTGNMLIRNGVVVAETQALPAGFDGLQIDLEGSYVMPGLVEMHTHSFGNQNPRGPNDSPRPAGTAQRMLFAGVTAFLDLFGDEDELYETRARQRAGELGGADLLASLSCLTAPEGHCTEYGTPTRTMQTPEQAKQVVNSLAARNPDVIKIIYQPHGFYRNGTSELTEGGPSIDRLTLQAAIAEAKAHGLKTIIHIDTWEDVRDAAELGADAITHVPPVPIPQDVLRLMVDKEITWIPTLALTDFMAFVFEPAVLDNPLARAVTPSFIIDAYHEKGFMEQMRPYRESGLAGAEVVKASVKAGADAGVIILTGTDSGNVGTIQGYSVHRELIKLVEAGLSEWQALAAATIEAGKFLNRNYGVNPGDEANLLVLGASPITNIANTQKIEMVIHHGEVVDRAAMLESGMVSQP